jgi:hypothetical protein
MESALKRRIAGAAAGLALLAGAGGAAFAASSGGSGSTASTGRDAFLGDVAKRLNVTPQKLKDAVKGAFSDRLDADVAAGRLTRAEADRIKKEADEHGGFPLGGPGPGPGFGGPGFGRHDFHGGPPPLAGPPPPGAPPLPPGRPPHGPPGPIMAGLDAAAKYLGLTGAQLRTQLGQGKSLADVAAARHKPLDGLKSAIEAAVTSDLHGRLDAIVHRRFR